MDSISSLQQKYYIETYQNVINFKSYRCNINAIFFQEFFKNLLYSSKIMNQDEDFQYVVSREDYNELKHSKAKCQQLKELLNQSQLAYTEDKKSYLDKIEVLEQELRSYKFSVRQYVDREIKEIDGLLKMLSQYRSAQSTSSLNLSSIEKIRSECQKVSEQFTLSLKNLEVINGEVITVIRNLVSDSLSLHEKLKEYQEMYDHTLEQKEDLYIQMRSLNEKNVFLEKQREKLLKGQERLKYENEILKFSVKQKQSTNLQLEIDLHNEKNKRHEQIALMREEAMLKEKKWRETLNITEKKLREQLEQSDKENSMVKRYLTEEIDNLRNRIENLMEQLQMKTQELSRLQVALKQQQIKHEQFKAQVESRAQSSMKLEQKLKTQLTMVKQDHACHIEMLESRYGDKQKLSLSVIDDLQKMLQQQAERKDQLLIELKETKQMQSRLRNQIEQYKGKLTIEREMFSETYTQLREQIQQKTGKLEEMEEKVSALQEMEEQYEERHMSQEQTLAESQTQLENSQQHISELQTKLRIKTQQLQRMQYDTQTRKQLQAQISKLHKVIAICQSQKTVLESSIHSLNQQLTTYKKLTHQSTKKLSMQNEQLIIQLKITVDNLQKKKLESEEILRVLNQVKQAKNNVENQYCQLAQLHQRELKTGQRQLEQTNNQVYMLRAALDEKIMGQDDLVRQVDSLKQQVRNMHSAQQSCNLLRMELQSLQTQCQRLSKQKSIIKKQRQSLNQSLSQSRLQVKFLNQQLNNLKLYIDQLEQNLQKLSEQKTALKNEMHLFKEQAEFCKRESIEQLGIIDHLQRDLQSSRYILLLYTCRKQLKAVSQSIDPLSIVRRTSLSKGEKAYYVKEMILEYRNQMKRNLEDIGALSHEEINELIMSELKELGNYVRKLMNQC